MDDLKLLGALRADFPAPGEGRLALIGEALDREISGQRTLQPTLGRWVPRLAVVGASVATCAVLILVQPFGGTQQRASAADVLRQIAAVAAVQPPEKPPGLGEFLYTRSENAAMTIAEGGVPDSRDVGLFVFLTPQVRETWLGPDRHGSVRITDGPPAFLTDADEATFRESGVDLGEGSDTMDLGKDDNLTEAGASRLPLDPEALRRYIAQQTSGTRTDRTANTLETIEGMLGEQFVPPAVRAELLRIAAELPGIELVGSVRDEVGREGVAVAVERRRLGRRHELIFDPQTSVLLGTRDVVTGTLPKLIAPHVPLGTRTGYKVYLESAIVKKEGARPPEVEKPNPGRAAKTVDEAVGARPPGPAPQERAAKPGASGKEPSPVR